MIWTLKNFPKASDKRILDLQASQEMWKFDIEQELVQKAIRLLQCRAGGRYSMFEAGLLYQTCLVLGLEDSRPGKIGEQELAWESLVGSCSTEKEALQKLKMVLSIYVPLIPPVNGKVAENDKK
jgi:hypothetical protein